MEIGLTTCAQMSCVQSICQQPKGVNIEDQYCTVQAALLPSSRLLDGPLKAAVPMQSHLNIGIEKSVAIMHGDKVVTMDPHSEQEEGKKKMLAVFFFVVGASSV